MGQALRWEDTELSQERDERLGMQKIGKETARYLAPAISSFIRGKFKEEPDGMEQDDEAREVAEEVKSGEEAGTEDWSEVGEEQGNSEEDNIQSHGKVTVWIRGRRQKWELQSSLLGVRPSVNTRL